MSSNIYKNKKPVIFFLAPAFIFLAVFLYYPFLQNILNSFKEINNLGASAKGWNAPWYTNYIQLCKDPNIWTALLNTLIMIAATIIGQVGIAIVLALMVDNIKKGQKFFRTVYFFPIVIAATALGLLFNIVFLYDKGMLNQLRELLGATKLLDFKDSSHAMLTMIVPVTWQYVGFYFIILITGLNNISEELYEAATIDGASRWQRVRYISLPLLHNGNKIRRLQQALVSPGVQPRHPPPKQLHPQVPPPKIGIVHCGDFQLPTDGGLDRFGNGNYIVVVEVQTWDCVIGFWMLRLFLQREHIPLLVKFYHAKSLRVIHVITKNHRAVVQACRLLQYTAEMPAVENVVPQDHSAPVIPYELLPKDERLSQAVRGRLHLVGQPEAVLSPIPQ